MINSSRFPLLISLEDSTGIKIVFSQDILNEIPGCKVLETNFSPREIKELDTTYYVHEKGYVFADKQCPDVYHKRIPIDITENTALHILVNTIDLQEVVKVLESGWGMLGSNEKEESSVLGEPMGFFGPLN